MQPSETGLDPHPGPRDRALAVEARMPAGLFAGMDDDPERSVAWRIAPDPFAISPGTLAAIEGLGADLLAFYRALTALYARSARGTLPSFAAEYLDLGKPESIVKLGRQNRFKNDVPAVIRPDLILTEGGGFVAAELDSVPGGMGFVAGMTQAYADVGLATVGGPDGMALGLAAALAATAGTEKPTTAIVVSQESDSYRAELTWLAGRMRALDLGDTIVCRPEDIVFTEEALFVRLEGGEERKLDVLYRNFELFDLLNVAKNDLMLYAARHNRVKLTPPPKAHLEEKLAFALLHAPALQKFWRGDLGDAYDRIAALFPMTWVLDPRPLPPQAAIVGLEAQGEPVREWSALVPLGKSERDYVVKPSGFSELAWGSRGVKIANDLTKDDWQAAIEDGLAAYETTPHILQRFHKGRRIRVPFLDRRRDEVVELDGRVRLNPYFFVAGPADVRLGGILATIVPSDKRLIHGMSDAIMTPCTVAPSGA